MSYKRLLREYKNIQNTPLPYIHTKPKPENILEWHYVITGPPDSEYAGGEYHGTLTFPKEYPFAPPSIRMFTPNGRFKTNFRLCLSMSDYHPDTWNPAWSLASILTGLLSFMMENTATTGSTTATRQEKIALARQSRGFNRKNHVFRAIFPELCTPEHNHPVEESTQNDNDNAMIPKETPSLTISPAKFLVYGFLAMFLAVFLSKVIENL